MTANELTWLPTADHPELLADPVRAQLAGSELGTHAQVAQIDPAIADTAAPVQATEVTLESSANCLIVRARRGGEETFAAALVLATTKADINSTIRKTLGARKCSFMSMDDAVELTAMEYGGITPIGLPDRWPVLIDSRVVATEQIVIGSGLRTSKVRIDGACAAQLPGAQVIEGLAIEIE